MRSKTGAFVETLFSVFLLTFLFVFSSPAQSQEGIRVKEVKVRGNLRVEEDGIRLHVRTRAGDLLNRSTVDQDVKSIYRMGFFDDVRAELSDDGVLTYVVAEKPYIREINIQGNSQVNREKIEGALGIKPRTILDKDKVLEGVQRVKKLYEEQGYGNARIDYAISALENNQAAVHLDIEEGSRLMIKKISFEGNRAFSGSELKGLMATKEKWFLSFLTSRGVLDHDILTNDVAILSSHYYDHGYISHKIDEPVILKRHDGLDVVIRIEEGEQYRVGKVEIGGDLLGTPEEYFQMIQLTSGQIFRGSRLREDITAIAEKYANRGFAFAQVEPVTRVLPEEKKIDVALVIHQGPPVYFNRIVISGNTKTRDKVIRRELEAAEQERFSGTKITRSRNALQRTGYFEDVQLTTKRTDYPDAVDLLVDVKEGPTGSFSVGAGYSSGDQFIFSTSVSEKNLFGKGQSVSVGADLGFTRQDFVLSFTEPYLYDSPLTLGADAFNTRREFTDFTSRRTGFSMRTSYPLKHLDVSFLPSRKRAVYQNPELAEEQFSLLDQMRSGLSYELTREKVSSIDSAAPAAIRDERGISWTSSITPSMTYDSRDHFFTPTEGTHSVVGLKFAGLGGDNRFLKADGRGRWYHTLMKSPRWGTYTLSLGGTLGYGIGFRERINGRKDLPVFERYFPGGIDTVRGFKERSLGPREGNDVVGGDKQAVLNAEVMFPVLEQYGLRGVAFFDMGQAFRKSESISFGQFRRSIGVGGRWLSPFGPLRVDLGFPLNKKPGDDTSIVGFSIGGQP